MFKNDRSLVAHEPQFLKPVHESLSAIMFLPLGWLAFVPWLNSFPFRCWRVALFDISLLPSGPAGDYSDRDRFQRELEPTRRTLTR